MTASIGVLLLRTIGCLRPYGAHRELSSAGRGIPASAARPILSTQAGGVGWIIRRALLIAFLVFAAPAAAAVTLTPSNSIVEPFQSRGVAELSGTGCGASASTVKPLAEGAFNIKVLKPKVGDRDGGTRVSEVLLNGTQITVTAVADDPSICDPAASSEPPETRSWRAQYDVEATYDRRFQAGIRNDYFGKYKIVVSPKQIRTSPYDVFVKMKWKSYGARKATGSAVYRQKTGFRGLRCNKKLCPFNNGKAKVVGRKVKFCQESGRFEYEFVDFFVRGKLIIGVRASC